MSYILDALRKADAQRERDPARGIHAQSLQGTTSEAGGPRVNRNIVLAAAAALLVVAAAAGWFVTQRGSRGDKPASQVDAAAPGHAAARSSSPPAVQVLPPPVMVAKAPVITSSVVPVQAAAPLALQASRPEPAPLIMAPAATGQPAGMAPSYGPSGPGMAPLPANPGMQAPVNAAVPGSPNANIGTPNMGTPNAAIAPPNTAVGTSNSMAAPRGAAPIPPSQPLPPVHGLPPDAPKIVINGGVYSANAAQRMLIVNGQVVKEGADLGSGVKLEQITAKSAVLSFRGGRYTVGY